VLDSSYVYEIEDILAEINRRTSRRLELHPFWKYPIWKNSFAGFKIHEKFVVPEHVMHLSIPAKDFIQYGQTKKLSDAATSQITREIESFFGEEVHSTEASG
jgi:hypothetical protein